MSEKRAKMWGRPEGKEAAVKDLGVPSEEWERNARKLEHRNRMRPGEPDLDLAGICGYGGIKGYLDYLAESLVKPLGVGTGLVSEEEEARIRAVLEAETKAEIAKYEARRRELERSSEAVEAYVRRMQSWLLFCHRMAPDHADDDLPEMLQEMERQAAAEREADLKALRQDIEDYTHLLATLRDEPA